MNVKNKFGRGFDDVMGAIEEVTGKQSDEFVEADLETFGDDLLKRYLREVDEYRDRMTRATYDNMQDIKNAHGIQHGFEGANALKDRKLMIDESDAAEFLDDNVMEILQSYDNQLAGGEGTARRGVVARPGTDHQGADRGLRSEDQPHRPDGSAGHTPYHPGRRSKRTTRQRHGLGKAGRAPCGPEVRGEDRHPPANTSGPDGCRP